VSPKELRGNDGVWAAGNYSVTVKDKTIQGNWFRILKRENRNWKIAMEAFGRTGAIDAPLPPRLPTANRTAIYRGAETAFLSRFLERARASWLRHGGGVAQRWYVRQSGP
jgi:hypothetical protein